jgi:hypothetical protein
MVLKSSGGAVVKKISVTNQVATESPVLMIHLEEKRTLLPYASTTSDGIYNCNAVKDKIVSMP